MYDIYLCPESIIELQYFDFDKEEKIIEKYPII